MWGLSTFLGMGAAFLSPWGLFCPLHCPSTTPQNPFYAVRRVGKETPFLLFPSPLQPPHAGVETSMGDEAGAGEEGSCWGEAVLGGAEGAALVLPPHTQPVATGTVGHGGQEWGNGVGKLMRAESNQEPRDSSGEEITPLPFPPWRTQPWFLQITRCLSERALIPSAAQPLGVVGRGGGLCPGGDPRHCGTDVSPPRCATDHNSDNTTAMLQEWLQAVGSNYHSVAWKAEEGPRWGWEGTTLRCTPPSLHLSPARTRGFACVLLPARLGADSGRRHAVCVLSLCVPSRCC